VGKAGFVAEHGLHNEEQRAAIERTVSLIEERQLRTIRTIWVDQHGAPRCKYLSIADYLAALENGVDFSSALYNMDTANNVFTPLFAEGGGLGISELTGFPDMILVPDPTTFRVLPWADRTGWVITDPYFTNGRAVPIDARHIMRQQVDAARQIGFDFVGGLEVEFYVVRRDSPRIELTETGWPAPPPSVSVIEQGYQYLSEVRIAALDDLTQRLRDAYLDLGLPLRSIEDEWGPGQIEVTFNPMTGLDAADAMVLFRSATKQIAQNMGLLATFMTRPAFPNFFSSGWHLHESLRDRESGKNTFASESPDEAVSEIGKQFAAGLIEYARTMTVFSTPTITGYKRFKPYSFAPDRANWALENRGAYLRVQGEPMDPGTHFENRLGEPCANPFLYMAANIAAGIAGIREKMVPPPMVVADPYADDDSAKLPASLWEAVSLLEKDTFFRDAFGPEFVTYMTAMKQNECSRFLGEVTDWEMREYFEFF
jgi:glutamine synthetase